MSAKAPPKRKRAKAKAKKQVEKNEVFEHRSTTKQKAGQIRQAVARIAGGVRNASERESVVKLADLAVERFADGRGETLFPGVATVPHLNKPDKVGAVQREIVDVIRVLYKVSQTGKGHDVLELGVKRLRHIADRGLSRIPLTGDEKTGYKLED